MNTFTLFLNVSGGQLKSSFEHHETEINVQSHEEDEGVQSHAFISLSMEQDNVL